MNHTSDSYMKTSKIEIKMKLWIQWWKIVKQLRPCFSRNQTFMWFSLVLIGFSTRTDLAGVTSIIRSLGLEESYYDRLLDFFHSTGINLDGLSKQWSKIILKLDLGYKVNGRLIVLGDGIKVSKEGRKMPAVRWLHQGSESNSKPKFIMGQSCQALSLLMTSASYFFSVPMICRVHEGIIESSQDTSTQMDKLISMLNCLEVDSLFYLVADAYYANQKIVLGLLAKGQHLISRVKTNAVAYLPVEKTDIVKSGRKKFYGEKIKLRDVFKDTNKMTLAEIAMYNEGAIMIPFRSLDLLWRPVGIIVRFVFVMHPTKGNAILMSTDLSLDPIDIIKTYALRFKIEVSFKSAVNTIGAYAYHFWMKSMHKIKRKSENQYLQNETQEYRNMVKRKMSAYHAHIQIGLIAQGLLQVLSMTSHQLVWQLFGSWIRTIRPGILPSEQVVMTALRNTLPEFLKGTSTKANLEKFILEKVDLRRREGQLIVA